MVVFGLRSWVNRPIPVSLAELQLNEHIQPSPALELLEESGYDVIGGKMKVPLAFEAGESVLYSRLFIDYVAERDDARYLVKHLAADFRLNSADLRSGTVSFLICSYILDVKVYCMWTLKIPILLLSGLWIIRKTCMMVKIWTNI